MLPFGPVILWSLSICPCNPYWLFSLPSQQLSSFLLSGLSPTLWNRLCMLPWKLNTSASAFPTSLAARAQPSILGSANQMLLYRHEVDPGTPSLWKLWQFLQEQFSAAATAAVMMMISHDWCPGSVGGTSHSVAWFGKHLICFQSQFFKPLNFSVNFPIFSYLIVILFKLAWLFSAAFNNGIANNVRLIHLFVIFTLLWYWNWCIFIFCTFI